jgi:hypothetical protein
VINDKGGFVILVEYRLLRGRNLNGAAFKGIVVECEIFSEKEPASHFAQFKVNLLSKASILDLNFRNYE